MLVEEILPEEFFCKLGRYVATCGHIERVLLYIIIHLESSDLDDLAVCDGLLEARKRTDELINRLKIACPLANSLIQVEIQKIIAEIEGDKRDPRNMAIHGAWTWSEKDKEFRVDYYKNFGTRRSPNWKAYGAPVSEQEVDDAVAHVDGILRRAHRVLSALAAEGD